MCLRIKQNQTFHFFTKIAHLDGCYQAWQVQFPATDLGCHLESQIFLVRSAPTCMVALDPLR
ncbi:hypothetical protein HOLleu_07742 [Holothuria leucospilota]|uniref:Uncharacterized protein n=1 Tax=Holothuria leucospilota TaxID=206669 RepID=A0A9Q1HH73_HOLLE|nr:hypothetical protein HOLleu_07742 [Holothuria leucospilota]